MNQLPHFLPQNYEGKVFRNIYTCAPSQDLLNDLVDGAEQILLDELIQWTSDIDHSDPQTYRSFQYGQIDDDEIYTVFKKEKWGCSRFSDGRSYGVWYGAESELTSVFEAAWWAFQLGKDNVLSRGEVYTVDRLMYQASVHSKLAIDLLGESGFFELLTSNEYTFCHRLGQLVQERGLEMLRTPSARHPNGVCTPVFVQEVIQSAEKIYYLRFHINLDEVLSVSSSRSEMNFSFRFEADGPKIL